MGIWMALLLVVIAGVIGGAVNALMSDNGFALPRQEIQGDVRILRPGYLGNMFVGGVAAAISWGLYGPASGLVLVVDQPAVVAKNSASAPPSVAVASSQPTLTLSGLVGALLVGVAGARWLSNEVDKSLLRAAASQAAGAGQNDQLAVKLAIASPAQALQAATVARAAAPQL